MSAKLQAVRDIFTDLAQNNKCFIAFVKELDPVMEELVNEQLKAQSSISNNKKL
jgi:hypothetical protein